MLDRLCKPALAQKWETTKNRTPHLVSLKICPHNLYALRAYAVGTGSTSPDTFCMDEIMTDQAWLRCTISPGQFSGEYAVKGEMYNGEGFSLFASEEDLECRQFPSGSERTSAWIMVQVIEQDKGLALVGLPAQTLENGQTVTVSASSLKFSPAKQKA
jgi:hypothetical protein